MQELLELLESDPSFVVPIFDAFSSLSLTPELEVLTFIFPVIHSRFWQDSVRTSALRKLSSSKVEALPVLVKFILRSVGSEAGAHSKVVKELRKNLILNTPTDQKAAESESMISGKTKYEKLFDQTT